MSQRLVEILEYGWDLDVRCRQCKNRRRISMPEMLKDWRKYLNAPVADIIARLKCRCGGSDFECSTLGATYANFGMLHDAIGGRARWIFKTLTEAGLDPAAYGYGPPPPPRP